MASNTAPTLLAQRIADLTTARQRHAGTPLGSQLAADLALLLEQQQAGATASDSAPNVKSPALQRGFQHNGTEQGRPPVPHQTPQI